MWIIPMTTQKTVTKILLAHRPTLTFFGANSSWETHGSDCCLVSSLHVTSNVIQRRKISSLLRLNKVSPKFLNNYVWDQLWATVATISWIDVSYSSGYSKSKLPNKRFPWYRPHTHTQYHIFDFFICFECGDLNWVCRKFIFVRPQQYLVKFFTIEIDIAETVTQLWILFLVFISAKIMLDPHTKLQFFHFRQSHAVVLVCFYSV